MGEAQTAVHAATSLSANQIAVLKGMIDTLTMNLNTATMMATQYRAVVSAVNSAQTAIDGLTDKSTDAEVDAANTMVTDARTALTGADALDADDTARLESQVARVESQIADMRTARANRPDPAIVASLTEVAKTKEKAITTEAGQVDAGLGGSDVDQYDLAIEHKDGAASVKITDAMLDDDDDPKFEQVMDFGDGRTMHVRAMELNDDGEVVEEVVIVSTDIEAPKATAFAKVMDRDGNFPQELDVNQKEEGSPFRSLAVNTGNVGMWSSAEFPSTPMTTRNYPQDEASTEDMNEGAFMGMFNGAPGTFECESANCSIETDGDGKLERVVGTWHFTPDKGATSDVPDADYLNYGFWLERTKEGGVVTSYGEIETFAGSEVKASEGSNLRSVKGSASYEGGAVGVYVKSVKNPDGSRASATSGHFTADANLKAYFRGTSVAEDDRDAVTGTIDNFSLQHGEENAWSVDLKGASNAETDSSTISGTANGGGTPGTFSGTFHGPTEEYSHDENGTTVMIHRQPHTVVGEFNANFSDGSVAGGFGVRKQ